MRRSTIQRSLVLEAVCKLQCHANADEIYNEIVITHPHISRTTVYRNLNLLSDMGKLRKVEIPGGAVCFDHNLHNHFHVTCERCGRVFDVDMEYVDDLEKNIKDTHGFDFIGYDIIFRGICPECKNKKQ